MFNCGWEDVNVHEKSSSFGDLFCLGFASAQCCSIFLLTQQQAAPGSMSHHPWPICGAVGRESPGSIQSVGRAKKCLGA